MRPYKAVALLLLTPMLMAGKCRPDKDKDGTVDNDADIDLPSPKDRLVVAGMDPSVAEPGAAFDAEVFGSGFTQGARVSFEGIAAERTSYTDDGTLKVRVPALDAGTYDVTVTAPDGATATLRNGLRLLDDAPAGCPVVTVHFELDSTGLFPEDLATLRSAAACFAKAGNRVRVEGHCDERGTTEYNLALGQRRADAVANYLSGAGLSRDRMKLISYGEEQPLATGHDEASYAQNRRAVAWMEN